MTAIVRELLAGKRRDSGAADQMLQTAEWAAGAFAGMTHGAVDAIVRAAAEAGFAHAGALAEAAVKETGFGVAADKKVKNEICSRGIHEAYRAKDFCSKRVRADDKIVEIPRPAGVVFALTPSTNPVCTVYFKILMALMTRNAIVVSPHPMAKGCSAQAARIMAAAAEKAGAPAGVIQVIDEPNLALVDHVMRSPRVNVILATGGTPMVRAAYSSGTPAIGVGPGNAPVLVDASADVDAAARRIVESKSFDHSVLCTNESVVVAEEAIADRLLAALGRAGAHIAKPDEVEKLRALLFDGGSFNVAMLGRSAATIAEAGGFRVSPATRVLVAPIDRVGIDEALSREKLCPVLGFVRAPHVNAGIATARALARLAGAGHSAAIHSRTPANVMAFGAVLKVLRVAVNAPCSQGAAGFATHLAPTFTIGTGFFGRSSVGENIGPEHLINWTRIAYSSEDGEPFGDFSELEPWSRLPAQATGRESPISLGVLQEGAPPREPKGAVPRGGKPKPADDLSAVREEIRRVVLEELRRALQGIVMAELRSFIFIDQLQPQTLCYLATWMRGQLPRANMAAQIIEVAPGLDIEALTDVALKHAEVAGGVLVVERQYGTLEFHGRSTAAVKAAAGAVLDALGAAEASAMPPRILAARIVTGIDPVHAFLINRNKIGSMILPGESLFVLEMQPASYAILAANEAEKAAEIKIIDYRMIGATGRVYLSGEESSLRAGAEVAEATLAALAA